MSGFVNSGMDKGLSMESDDRIEKIVDIYITAEAVRNMKHGNNTKDFDTQTSETQTPQQTGSNSVKSRSSRAALVCLVLLCFLLLTAVIVLSVFIYKNNTNYIEERCWLLTNITKITEDRDKLLSRNINLTKERNQLVINITNLTEERKELFRNNSNLSQERDQLKLKNGNLLKKTHIVDGWNFSQSSFYYLSTEMNKMIESRKDCITRGADLIVINNQQEQDFVKKMTGVDAVWIGVNDNVTEGTWRWVDGSTLTSSFWGPGEPNGGRSENCAVSADRVTKWPQLSGWLDISCDIIFKWICEMNITQLLQNLSDN